MVRRRFDPRFVELSYELSVLSNYLDLITGHLPRITAEEERRVWDEHSDTPDLAAQLAAQVTDGITTRFFAGSVVAALWAIYEAGVSQLAAYIATSKGIDLPLSALRGSFLDRAQKYFSHVLRFDLHPVTTDWSRLKGLQVIRNVVAHGNGRLASINNDARKKLVDIASQDPTVRITDGYLVVSLAFAKTAFQFIETLLSDLKARVQKEY